MISSKPAPTLEEMRSELETVLSGLQKSLTSARFLAYICEEYFNGRSERLKEYTIAVEAFGRDESFQPKDDPIVRVHASRLRQHLADYYRGEGREHRVQINLPKGGYIPQFVLAATEAEKDSPPEVSAGASGWPRRRHVIAGSALLLCVLALLGWRLHSGGPAHSTGEGRASGQGVSGDASAATLPLHGEEVRILVGSNSPAYIDKLGRVWGPDRYFSGGGIKENQHLPTSRVYDPNLWKLYRTGGAFQYDIPLKPGYYELHLYLAEPVFGLDDDHGGEISRLMDVLANEHPLLTEFDIIRDSGGATIADERVFLVSPAADGYLHLKFSSREDNSPILNALELIPTDGPHMRPLRITTRARSYVSRKQVIWSPDRYYVGGRRHEVFRNPVSNSDDPELFATERFGNFSYTIPVPEGRYTAVFHFSESWFGSVNPAQGPGLRLFDVYFNGTTLLKDFDIYHEAGGANRELRKEFHGLRPNALGKLNFTFEPIRNNACINAIEIIPED